MDERLATPPGQEHLPPMSAAEMAAAADRAGRGDEAAPGGAAQKPAAAAGQLDDPRLLQILSTEHWSLLSQRSLVYNEAFARAGMFLTFLSASLVALAFVANAMAFSREFLVIAVLLLTLDLFIGLATVGRVLDATIDDLRAIQGMNRIRNAYVQMVPASAQFFISSVHDDARGVLATYGEPATRSPVISFLHGMTTAGAMVGTIVSVLGGVVLAMLLLLLGSSAALAVAGGVAGFVAVFVGHSRYEIVAIQRFEAEMEAMFPTPEEERTIAPGKR
jgi:hypothetical protein